MHAFPCHSLSGVKKIGFFGLGKSNVALLSALPLSDVGVTLRSEGRVDTSLIPRGIFPERILEGERAFDSIDEDLLLLSPSVRRDRPPLLSAAARGVRLSSDAELFFEAAGDLPIIGITGSDGKSTSATLTHLMLSESYNAALIGNIGAPMLPALSSGAEIFTAELSSFMLEYLKPRLFRSAITSVTPNHLNWHSSFSEYLIAKLSVIEAAREPVASVDGDMLKVLPRREYFAVTSAEHTLSELKSEIKAQLYFTFDGKFININGAPFLSAEKILRRESHNVKNLMTAMALTHGLVPECGARRVAAEFSGLSHRCELFFSRDGVDFFDSSIDTTPERTRATLESLSRRCVLILAGRGKSCSYATLAPTAEKYCSRVIITGEDRGKMHAALSPHVVCEVREDFESAVRAAIKCAECGEAVLLSPAATSYDAFSDFEARGRFFKETVFRYFGEK